MIKYPLKEPSVFNYLYSPLITIVHHLSHPMLYTLDHSNNSISQCLWLFSFFPFRKCWWITERLFLIRLWPLKTTVFKKLKVTNNLYLPSDTALSLLHLNLQTFQENTHFSTKKKKNQFSTVKIRTGRLSIYHTALKDTLWLFYFKEWSWRNTEETWRKARHRHKATWFWGPPMLNTCTYLLRESKICPSLRHLLTYERAPIIPPWQCSTGKSCTALLYSGYRNI